MRNFNRATCITLIGLAATLSGCSEENREAKFDGLQNLPMPLAIDTATAQNAFEPIRPLPKVTQESLSTPMVNLGRDLFHDTRLSGDGTLTCASCHSLDTGGVDNLMSSIGIRGQIGPINSPTVFNSGFNFRQFWDGRSPSLDDQARGPVEASIEMGADWDVVIETLSSDKKLGEQFKVAFGSKEITEDRVVFAIARFEETLITPSPFDQYLTGNIGAINANQRKGYELFKEYGCASCHQGINVGGNLYQKMGAVQKVDLNAFLTDSASPEIQERGKGLTMVKVPSLRNVELTSPYFHGGKITDLHTAVRIMGLSQTATQIPDEDIDLIVDFLKSLTGDWRQHAAAVE